MKIEKFYKSEYSNIYIMKEYFMYLNLLNPDFYKYKEEENQGLIEHSKIIFEDIIKKPSYHTHPGDVLAVHYQDSNKCLQRVYIKKDNKKVEKIEDIGLVNLILRFKENKDILKEKNPLDRRIKFLKTLHNNCLEQKKDFNLYFIKK